MDDRSRSAPDGSAGDGGAAPDTDDASDAGADARGATLAPDAVPDAAEPDAPVFEWRPPAGQKPPITPWGPPPDGRWGASPADAATIAWAAPGTQTGPSRRRFSIGSVVGRSLDTYGSEWSLFLFIGLPYALVFGIGTVADPLVWPSTLVGILLGLVTTGVATLIAADLWTGGSATVGSALARTVRRLVPLVLSFTLLMLAAGLIGAGVTVVAGVALGLLGPLGVLVTVVVVPAGILALIVLLIRTTLVGPAVLLEGHGPLGGLKRSWALTRGSTWRLFGLLLLFGLIVSIASAGSGTLSSYAVDRWIAGLGLALGTLIVAPLYAIPTTLVFLDLGGRRGRTAPGTGPAGPSELAAVTSGPSASPGPSASTGLAGTPDPRIRVGRGRWIAMGIVIGIGVVLAVAGGAAVEGSGGLAVVPDRGRILAGHSFNLFDPCRPGDLATTFDADDEIRLGGYFLEAVPIGEAARLRFLLDGEELLDEPIEGTGFVPLECWFEPEAVVDLPPGAYRVVVSYEGRTIAEGGFAVE
jgi:hypothetical protein